MVSFNTERSPLGRHASVGQSTTTSGTTVQRRLRGRTFGEQEALLTPGDQSGDQPGGAPIQMKGGKRKGFKRGTEITEHKSNTKEAREDYVEQMHATNATLAGQLHEILESRVQKGNQLFYHLQTRVMGAPGLAAEYAAQFGESLYDAIDETDLNDHQKDYLENCVQIGRPTFEDKIKLALGLVTKTKGDKKEVAVLVFDDPAPAAEKLAVVRGLEEEIVKCTKQPNRHKAFVAFLEHGDKKEAGKGRGETQTEHDDKLCRFADEELAALVGAAQIRLVNKTPLKKIKRTDKGQFKKDLSAWILRHTKEEHAWVTRNGSLTRARFAAYTNDAPIGDKVRWSSKDVTKIMRLITLSAPVPDDFYFDDERDTDTMGTSAKEEREEDKALHGQKLGKLRHKLDKKIGKHEDDSVGTNSAKLAKLIKALDDDEKDYFLRSYLSPGERAEWDDPELDHGRRQELRQVCLDALSVELKQAGLGHGGKTTELRDKLLKKLTVGFNKTPTFKRIKDLAKSELPHDMDPAIAGPKLLALVRKLRGDEFATLRGNAKIMEALEARSSPKVWALISAILGISDQHDEVDGVKGKVTVDLFNETGERGETKNTRTDARRMGADEAELKPSHWGALLTATLKHSKTKKSSEVNSIVTRACMAGRRRERVTKAGDKALSGTQTMAPMSVADFMAGVEQTVSPAAMKVFERETKYKHALDALRAGTFPTVDEQIEDAIFRNKAKYVSGDHAQVDNVERTWDDLAGEALLEEWSNIREWRIYKARYDTLKGRERRVAKEKLRTFVVDIRKDRHDLVLKKFSPKSQGKALKSLRLRLSDAMAKDPEVIATLDAMGFDNDELSQAKTKTLALTDEQKLRSTGAQYNSLPPGTKQVTKGQVKTSSKSAQTKESMSELFGSHRKAEGELSGGKDRGEVVDDNIDDIQHHQEELARRGVNFDKLQKRFNRALMFLAKGLVIALTAAAMAAITVLTGGVGGVLGVALGAVLVTCKAAVLQAVKLGLEGDRFNTTKALSSIAFKAILGLATGALAEFAVPEALEAVGMAVTNPGANVGFESLVNEGASTQSEQATKASIEFALGKGAKSALKTAYKEVTSTEYKDPAARSLILLELGGIVLAGGATVANEVWVPVNDALQRGDLVGVVTGDSTVDRGLEKGAQTGGKGVTKGLAYTMKAAKYAPKLRKLLVKLYAKSHAKGDDRDDELATLIPQAIANGHEALTSLDEQIDFALKNDGDYAELAMSKSEVYELLEELETEYAVWQKTNEDKRGSNDQVTGANHHDLPVLAKALELNEKLAGLA